MKTWILALAMALTTAPCFGDRVIDLPENGQKWFLTAVYSNRTNPTDKDRQLAAILRGDLAHLVSQVNFVEWDNSTAHIKGTDWQAYLGSNRPALILQTPPDSSGKGSVIYFASGPHLKTDANLVGSVAAAVNRYKHAQHGDRCPDGRCPLRPRQPEPAPAPAPVQPIPTIVPDIDVVVNPKPKEPEKSVPWWALLLPLIGAGLGLRKALLGDIEGDDGEEEVV